MTKVSSVFYSKSGRATADFQGAYPPRAPRVVSRYDPVPFHFDAGPLHGRLEPDQNQL
jgi:hypothetical protein